MEPLEQRMPTPRISKISKILRVIVAIFLWLGFGPMVAFFTVHTVLMRTLAPALAAGTAGANYVTPFIVVFYIMPASYLITAVLGMVDMAIGASTRRGGRIAITIIGTIAATTFLLIAGMALLYVPVNLAVIGYAIAQGIDSSVFDTITPIFVVELLGTLGMIGGCAPLLLYWPHTAPSRNT